MAHVVKRCSRCRRRVPAGDRTCECGGRVRWMARYVDPEGVERAQVFERQQDAEDFLANVEAAKAAGEYRDPKAGRETLRSVYFRFRSETTLEPTTRAKWDGVWRNHVETRLGKAAVAKITRNAVIATRDEPASPWQGNEAVKLVKRVL